MYDLDQQAIKVYGEGGMKFSVNEKDMVMQLPESRRKNKDELSRVVSAKILDLENSFRDRDDKIQRIVETE